MVAMQYGQACRTSVASVQMAGSLFAVIRIVFGKLSSKFPLSKDRRTALSEERLAADASVQQAVGYVLGDVSMDL